MIVADNADKTTTATKLGIAVDNAVSSVNSGDLHLRTVSMNTALSSLNGGGGVADGTVTFTDSTGNTATLTVDSSMQTVGNVVNAINRLGLGGLEITASLNRTGDGILLTDTAGGSGTMSVAEGDSTTAADLNLLQTTDGTTIDGSMTRQISLTSSDTLEDLVTAINSLTRRDCLDRRRRIEQSLPALLDQQPVGNGRRAGRRYLGDGRSLVVDRVGETPKRPAGPRQRQHVLRQRPGLLSQQHFHQRALGGNTSRSTAPRAARCR